MNISLNVLDEYARILTPNQANKLYESKAGEAYTKSLYENKVYSLYLSSKNIYMDSKKAKAEFALDMTLKFPELMESVSYKIDEDGISFKTTDRSLYRDLQWSLIKNGIYGDTIMDIRDKKF